MIRIGVVSDSHMMLDNRLRSAADALKARGVSRLIHLGDGAMDWDRLSVMLGVPLTAVAGNCDGSMVGMAQEAVITVEGTKLLLCHGHRLGVKFGLIRLKLRAEELGCQVGLFGHTHEQTEVWNEGILLLNPGALRDGRFAVLTVDGGAVSVALGP